MKNFIYTVTVLSLLGTTSFAAPALNLKGLPPAVQSRIQEAAKRATEEPNPVQNYVDGTKKRVEAQQAVIDSFMVKYPYLKDNPIAKALIAAIPTYYPEIGKSLQSLEKQGVPQVTNIQSVFGGIASMYKVLTEQTFPQACKEYPGDKTTGWVRLIQGSRTTYALYPTDNREDRPIAGFLQQADGTYDVGQIGTGKEYVVSIANNSEVQVQLADDGKGKKVVVCIGDFIKRPTK